MEEIRLHVESEYGQLESVLVNKGGSVLDSDKSRDVEKEYGDQRADEERYHPESAPYNAEVIRFQHKAFLDVLTAKRVQLYLSEDVENAIDQIFTRDIGIVIGNTFYETSLGDNIRKIEQLGLKGLRERFSNYVQLAEGVIEGGDVFVHQKKVFVGITKKSTNWDGFYGLQKVVEPQGYECIPIRCAEDVLHLDCRFGILSKDEAFLYRQGMHPEDVKVLEQFFNVIDLDDDLIDTLGSNFTLISEREVIIDARNNKIKDLLLQKGFSVVSLDYSEITKKWGAFRCTTLPLYRQ